ncbi:uncharacterized protein [Periplaneta americana]|uniref:uncharacterized protein isoform X2 n=1 Tax=Periplaneta americana TaxID=6978 RepID=UPI0037E7FB3A
MMGLNLLAAGVLTSLLLLASTDSPGDNEVRVDEREKQEELSAAANSSDEKQGSASHFVPSFGPPQPPDHYYDPYYFHTFGPSPILAYRYMFNHGYPYACTYAYNKYGTPFIPSPPDYFLGSHHYSPPYHPHVNFKLPYAEEYPHYLSPAARGFHYPGPHYVPHHPPNYYPVHHHHAHGHYPYHPPTPIHARGIPHNNPHAFHSVVNYGHINLHHGDHFEPHDNGKSPHPHPYPHHPYPPHPAGFLPPTFGPGPFLDFPSNGYGETDRADTEDGPGASKESKSGEVEKVVPK